MTQVDIFFPGTKESKYELIWNEEAGMGVIWIVIVVSLSDFIIPHQLKPRMKEGVGLQFIPNIWS